MQVKVTLVVEEGIEHSGFKKRARQSALPDDRSERAAIHPAVQGARNRPAAHDRMAAALTHALKALLREQVAEFRAREDAELMHAKVPAA